MKHRLLTLLFLLMSTFTFVNAQIDCNENLVVELDPSGIALVPISDFVSNIEFMLTQGTVSYYIFPGNTGVINSADDQIQIDCNNGNISYYLIEVLDGQDLIENCSNEFSINQNGACGGGNLTCEDVGCLGVKNVYVTDDGTTPTIIDAIDFSLCGEELGCMEYTAVYGIVWDYDGSPWQDALSTEGLTNFVNPVILKFTDQDTSITIQTYLYYWNTSNCNMIGMNSVTMELDANAEATLTPEQFMFDNGNMCDSLTIGITSDNGPAPTDYFTSIDVNCDNLGKSDVYIKNEANGEIIISSLFLIDPLEACGSILGDGDQLISLSSFPLNTTINTTVSLNGDVLPAHPNGIGWIVNEDDLIAGENTLTFDSSPFQLNGVSTLDMVLGLRIILLDEYDDELEPVAFDVDESGYNGIGDLVLMRALILGQNNGEDLPNSFFVHEDYTFPSDFDPFNFDNDFRSFTFLDTDFNNDIFNFSAYKYGDLNESAIPGFQAENNPIFSETRSFTSIGITDLSVQAGEDFTFEVKYESETAFRGFLAALISDGIDFLEITSEEEGVQTNIINKNEMRISYLEPNLLADITSISFLVSAHATKDGDLIDMLGLKSGFPQEVVDENNETVVIDDIETIIIVAVDSDNKLDVQLYPNPVSNYLTLEAKDVDVKSVRVFSMTNEVMYTNKTIDQIIDVSQWPVGIYYLQLETNKGTESVRFLKQ